MQTFKALKEHRLDNDNQSDINIMAQKETVDPKCEATERRQLEAAAWYYSDANDLSCKKPLVEGKIQNCHGVC